MIHSVTHCTFSDQVNTEIIFKIRHEVFVDEQKVSREEEFDEFELTSIHYLGYCDEMPAGTARWRITKDGIKLERFAVLKKYRLKGLAQAILTKVLEHVKPLGLPVYLNAQISAIEFYRKNGFESTGPLFMEAGIEHYKMTLTQV